MGAGFQSSWLYDGCHPDEHGEQFMAGRWFEALQAHCPGATVGPGDIGRVAEGEFKVSAASPAAPLAAVLAAVLGATAVNV